MNRVCTANRLGTGLGQTEVLYLSLLDQFLHGSRNIFNRHVRVDTMLIQKVDGVDVQSAQGCIRDLPDVVGPAVETIASAVGIDPEPKLGGNDNAIAERRE